MRHPAGDALVSHRPTTPNKNVEDRWSDCVIRHASSADLAGCGFSIPVCEAESHFRSCPQRSPSTPIPAIIASSPSVLSKNSRWSDADSLDCPHSFPGDHATSSGDLDLAGRRRTSGGSRFPRSAEPLGCGTPRARPRRAGRRHRAGPGIRSDFFFRPSGRPRRNHHRNPRRVEGQHGTCRCLNKLWPGEGRSKGRCGPIGTLPARVPSHRAQD